MLIFWVLLLPRCNWILRKSFFIIVSFLEIYIQRKINSYEYLIRKRQYRFWFVEFLCRFSYIIFVHILRQCKYTWTLYVKPRRSDRERSKDNSVLDEKNGITCAVVRRGMNYIGDWNSFVVGKKKKASVHTSGCRRCRDLHIKWVGIYNGRSFERC